MTIISEARPKIPPNLSEHESGASTSNESYSLDAPLVASEALTMNAPDGSTFSWKPTELVYRDGNGMLDFIVGSSPSTLSTRGREARYHRTFPSADDVFIAEDMQVKHWTVLHEPPRSPAEYLGEGIEFGVSGIVNGVPLPPGDHGSIEVGSFKFPRPFIKDLAGNEVYGRYEVVDTGDGQQLFIWFNAEFLDNALYPVMIDPTIVISNTIETDDNPGARKLVQLSNGDLIAGLRKTQEDGWNNHYIYLYRSRDNGLTWQQYDKFQNNSIRHFALGSRGTTVYVLYIEAGDTFTASRVLLRRSSFPAGDFLISSEQSMVNRSGGVSLAVDSSGGLYAAWSCINNTYPDSYNLKYSRSTDGGETWASPTQLTTYGGSGDGYHNPCIVAGRPNRPVIAVENKTVSSGKVTIFRLDSSWVSEDLDTSGNVSSPTMYAKSDDIYLAVKSGLSIEYFRSRNSGSTWPTNNVAVSSGVNYQPSIVVDDDDVVHLFWNRGTRVYHKTYVDGAWGADSIADVGENPSATVSDTIIGWVCISDITFRFDKFIFNSPPTSPTRLNRPDFDADFDALFSWQFNDPNPGDYQTAYRIEYIESASGAVSSNTGKVSSESSSHMFPAGTFENGKEYMWRVRTFDSRDKESPWSEWATFKCATLPIATISDPLPDAELTGDSYTFRGTYSQVEDVPQKSFRFLLWDQSGTQLIQDSGVKIGTTNTHTFDDLENEREYKVQLEVTSQDDMTGASDMVSFETAFVKPKPPSIALSQDSVFATTTTLVSNPEPEGDEPNVITNEIYRRRYGDSEWEKVGEAVSYFTDYLCPAGDIQYMAVAKGDNGTHSDQSDIAIIEVKFNGWWIVDMETSESFNFVFNVSQGEISLEEERQEVRTFSAKPFVRYGTFNAERGSLAGLKINGPGTARDQVDVLRELVSRRKPFYLKNNRGEAWIVNIYNLKRQYTIGLTETPSIDWVEIR